jgi:predicted nucleic acid-binding Zn ribbon protein
MNMEEPLEVKIRKDNITLNKQLHVLDDIENEIDTMNDGNINDVIGWDILIKIIVTFLKSSNIKKNIDSNIEKLSQSNTVKRMGIDDLKNVSLTKFDEVIESNKERLITSEIFERNNRRKSSIRILLHLLGLFVILISIYFEMR